MNIINTIQDYENLDRSQHIFRGQSNKDWDLLPGVYRDNSGIDSPALEKEVVNRFFRHLMENGYSLPTPNANLSDILTKPEADILSKSSKYPHDEMLSYLALAQHYAFDSQFPWLKTSLLDVTHNLDIATYFAVESGGGVDGKVFVFDPSTIKKPYRIYEPHGDFNMEARLVVQDCAFIYREQVDYIDEYSPYTNRNSFDEIVKDKIIIPHTLKSLLKEYLQKKLFDLFMYPRLILGRVTPDLATAGFHTYEELKELYRPTVDRAERLGNRHSDY